MSRRRSISFSQENNNNQNDTFKLHNLLKINLQVNNNKLSHIYDSKASANVNMKMLTILTYRWQSLHLISFCLFVLTYSLYCFYEKDKWMSATTPQLIHVHFIDVVKRNISSCKRNKKTALHSTWTTWYWLVNNNKQMVRSY